MILVESYFSKNLFPRKRFLKDGKLATAVQTLKTLVVTVSNNIRSWIKNHYRSRVFATILSIIRICTVSFLFGLFDTNKKQNNLPHYKVSSKEYREGEKSKSELVTRRETLAVHYSWSESGSRLMLYTGPQAFICSYQTTRHSFPYHVCCALLFQL